MYLAGDPFLFVVYSVLFKYGFWTVDPPVI